MPFSRDITAKFSWRRSEQEGPRLTCDERGFSLVEILVVLGIVAILSAIAAPLIPSLLKSRQLDSNVMTLTGILEQARETALSANTYVWVAFTAGSANSPTGTWVAVIESKDGTESPVNSSVIPSWTATMTVPASAYPNLQLLNKIQNLPGVQVIVDSTTLQNATTSIKNRYPNNYPPTGTPLQGSLSWTVTPVAFTQGYNATSSLFTNAVEFTPDGEAHVQTWNSNIQFVLQPSQGSAANNATKVVFFNVSRLTGKTTVYRD